MNETIDKIDSYMWHSDMATNPEAIEAGLRLLQAILDVDDSLPDWSSERKAYYDAMASHTDGVLAAIDILFGLPGEGLANFYAYNCLGADDPAQWDGVALRNIDDLRKYVLKRGALSSAGVVNLNSAARRASGKA